MCWHIANRQILTIELLLHLFYGLLQCFDVVKELAYLIRGFLVTSARAAVTWRVWFIAVHFWHVSRHLAIDFGRYQQSQGKQDQQVDVNWSPQVTGNQTEKSWHFVKVDLQIIYSASAFTTVIFASWIKILIKKLIEKSLRAWGWFALQIKRKSKDEKRSCQCRAKITAWPFFVFWFPLYLQSESSPRTEWFFNKFCKYYILLALSNICMVSCSTRSQLK